MSLTGTSAEEAATQWNQILVSMINPSAQAEEALSGLGMTFAGLRGMIADQGVIPVLRMLRDSMTDEQFTSMFGNIRALKGVMDLLGSSYENTLSILEDTADAGGTFDEVLQTQAARSISSGIALSRPAMWG